MPDAFLSAALCLSSDQTAAPSDTAQQLRRNLQTLDPYLSGPISPLSFSQIKCLRFFISEVLYELYNEEK